MPRVKTENRMNANVQFKGWDCKVIEARYGDGSLALRLVDAETYEPIAIATVCVDQPAPAGFVWVKDWSENLGMTEALTQAGLINPKPTARFQTGFVHATLHEYLGRAA